MEFNMLSISPSIFILTVFTLLFLMSSKRRRDNRKFKLAPKAPGWWSIVGHLHLFMNGKQPPHITLAEMAEKTGPIFTVKIGSHQTLVINTWELAKQCLTTNDKAFANRPKAIAKEIFGYNYSMFGFSPYGEYWREIRKIVTLKLLSNHQVDKLKYIVEVEVKDAIRDLYKKSINSSIKNHVLLDLQRWVRDVTMNLILRIVVGKRCPAWENAIRDTSKFIGDNFAVSDALPWLRWLDIGGNEKEMKKLRKVIDLEMSEWLEEHKEKKRNQLKEEEDEDFMDVLLSVLKDHPLLAKSTYDVDTIIKATCLVLIIGASEPTAVTLVSALSLIINNGHVLEDAKIEIDNVVGRDRPVKESDGKNLVYLNAIIKETLRLHPPSPLSSPHESIEDCIVGGFHIPLGTHLFVNLSKIQRDPRIWDNALEFRPERFLTKNKDIDVKGNHFMLLPFGGGRRICSGVSFALQVLNLTLASMLQAFEIKTPTGKPIDMSDRSGPSTAIEALLIPRFEFSKVQSW